MIVKIYWGYYTFNTITSVVKRMKPGPGTHVGRILKPYQPKGSQPEFFTPYVNGRRYTTTISKLEKKYA